jgi:hypothetical protein
MQQQHLETDFDSKSLMDLMALMEDQGSFRPSVMESPPPYPGLLNSDLKPVINSFTAEDEGEWTTSQQTIPTSLGQMPSSDFKFDLRKVARAEE